MVDSVLIIPWSKVSALTVEARAGFALRALAQEAFVESALELLYAPAAEDEAGVVDLDALVKEEVPLVCVADELELLDGFWADNISVAACTREFMSPFALYVKDEADAPPSISAIFPSVESVTAVDVNPA